MRFSLVTRVAMTLLLSASCTGGEADDLAPESADEADATDESALTLTPGIYSLVQVKGGNCAHFRGDGSADLTPAELYACHDSLAYNFFVERRGAGYQIRNLLTNKCLDVLGARRQAGTAVIEYPCKGTGNQLWTITNTSGTNHTIRAVHSGLYLDAEGGGKRSGTALVQGAFTGTDHQLWRFVAPPTPPAKATVRPAQARQSIDGFGIATAWGSVPSNANLDAYFSVTRGAGLSIVRNRIPFREAPSANDNFLGSGNYNYTIVNPGRANQYKKFSLNWNNWDLSATRTLISKLKANHDYQVTRYFSTPWTPPNNAVSRWKRGVADPTNHPEVGGSLDPAHYADYADVLADYALEFQERMGAPLSGISLQNEPNFECDYESADWSAAQIHDFTAVLKAEFAKKGVTTRLPGLSVITPEYQGFNEDLIAPTLRDSATAGVFGIVGVHQYDFGPWNASSYTLPALPATAAAGKRLWVTEWNASAFSSDPDEITTALRLARLLHQDLTQGNINAFVYWWPQSLQNGSTPSKLLWTLGQFSRFIRPDWRRVNADPSPAADVLVSAYLDPGTTRAAVVAINSGSAPRTFLLDVDGMRFGDVAPYRTSARESMAALPLIPGGSSAVTVTVPARSVTTFSASVAP